MESGVPGFETYIWFGLFAPAGMPAGAVSRLSGEISKVLAAPDYQSRITGTLGGEAAPRTPEQFAKFLRTDTPKWIKVIQDTGARVE